MVRIEFSLVRVSFLVAASGVLALQGSAQEQAGALVNLEPAALAARIDRVVGGPAAHSSARTVLVGRVLGPDGTPAAGAVVVTSAGGRAVTDAAGAFSLEVEVPVDAESVRVTAVMGSGTGSLVGSAQVGGLAPWGTTPAGTLGLEQAATCQPSWLPTFGGLPGTDGPILALTVFDDGSGPALYAGGYFTSAGGVPVHHIAKWDGTSWSALGSDFDESVAALTVFDDGTGPALFAGGSFSTAGGLSVENIAKWDGSSWSALGFGISGLYSSVNALTVFDDGSGPALYVGGEFSSAGGVLANNIAKWDGSSWSALGSGLGGAQFQSVQVLTVFADGSGPALYAGGNFTTAGGVAAIRIAKWDGSSWFALASGLGAEVRALTAFDDGSGPALYAGGAFSISKWDGTSWSALGSGLSGPYGGVSVNALAVFNDGSGPALYAGGDFATAGDVAANFIAKWDGSSWSALGSSISGDALENQQVYALTVFDYGTGPALYAGGQFYVAGGVGADRIAKWDGSGWSALGSGMDNLVYALTVFDDGSGRALYAGGNFLDAGSVVANRIAKWDGSSWSPLGSGMDGSVHALMAFDDGSGPALFAGGDFTTAGGVTVNSIAKWDGSNWSPLGSGMSGGGAGAFAPMVGALAVFDDGSGPALYAGGSFTSADGVAAIYIAKWNGLSWSAAGSTEFPVSALAVFDDGGGPALCAASNWLNFFCGQCSTISVIEEWDGSKWLTLFYESGEDVGVEVLTVYNDDSGPALYAGGNFPTAGGVGANSIARWDGSVWSALGSGMEGGVDALSAFDDGSGPALYAGGNFTTAGGVAASRIAKWDGSTWSALGSGMSDAVLALTAFGDGSGPALFAGGAFGSAPDSGDSFLAKWGCPPPPPVWTDLGFALPGSNGAPQLAGLGELTPGSTGRLTLTSAAPSALSILFLALDSTPSPFKCGTLVPAPVLTSFVVITNPIGEVLLGWSSWPAGLSGLSLYFQYGIQDAAAVCGVALSNALRADVP